MVSTRAAPVHPLPWKAGCMGRASLPAEPAAANGGAWGCVGSRSATRYGLCSRTGGAVESAAKGAQQATGRACLDHMAVCNRVQPHRQRRWMLSSGVNMSRRGLSWDQGARRRAAAHGLRLVVGVCLLLAEASQQRQNVGWGGVSGRVPPGGACVLARVCAAGVGWRGLNGGWMRCRRIRQGFLVFEVLKSWLWQQHIGKWGVTSLLQLVSPRDEAPAHPPWVAAYKAAPCAAGYASHQGPCVTSPPSRYWGLLECGPSNGLLLAIPWCAEPVLLCLNICLMHGCSESASVRFVCLGCPCQRRLQGQRCCCWELLWWPEWSCLL
jgi:hypothetical protein